MALGFVGGCAGAAVRVQSKGFAMCGAQPGVLAHRPTRLLMLAAKDGAELPDPEDPAKQTPPPAKGEKEQHKIPSSDVDWNSEWSRFTSSGMKSQVKGREPVPKAVLATKRSMNSAKRLTDSASASLPTWGQLRRDWRFWLAVILALSLLTSFLNTTAVQNYSGQVM